MVLVFTLYMLFALVFTIAKTALEYSEPIFLVGTRMLLAGALMLGYYAFKEKKSFQWTKSAVIRLGLLALFNIYLTNILEFWGLKYLTSFKTCFIYSLSPFLSAFLSYLVFSEVMTPKRWAGLAVGFMGFIPILLSQGAGEEQTGTFLVFSWAELSVMGAAATSVYGWILLRQLVKDDQIPPIIANGVSMFAGGSIALVNSYMVENWNPIPVTEVIPFLECTILLMIVSNMLAYNLYGHLLKRYTATFLSFAGFTTPLFTAFFGWTFLGEVPGKAFYVSSVIVFIGLYLFHQEELRKGLVIHKEPPEKETKNSNSVAANSSIN